jgi:hypothetical protein
VNRAALANFSRDDLIALVLAQHAQTAAQAEQISALSARLAELEAKLAAPPKTPDNSSLPPSKGCRSSRFCLRLAWACSILRVASAASGDLGKMMRRTGIVTPRWTRAYGMYTFYWPTGSEGCCAGNSESSYVSPKGSQDKNRCEIY